MLDAARAVARKVAAATPLVNRLREQAYARAFLRPDWHGRFLGVYGSFAEARAAAPDPARTGLDRGDYATIYDERLDRIYPYDYPVLFWLRGILRPGMKLFDFGGHVGVTWFGYSRVLPVVAEIDWVVCDLPAVVERGRRIREARGSPPALSFTTDAAAAADAGVLLSAGALQYMEQELHELLANLPRRPAHLLLNKLPLTKGPRFVTLQNAQVTVAPQHVFNESEFIEPLLALGYELVDRWEDPVHSCHIPFHAERSVPRYSGLYLRAINS